MSCKEPKRKHGKKEISLQSTRVHASHLVSSLVWRALLELNGEVNDEFYRRVLQQGRAEQSRAGKGRHDLYHHVELLLPFSRPLATPRS